VLAPELKRLNRFRWPISVLAILYLMFAAVIALSWHFNPLERLIPAWVGRIIYPIDKTNVDILRFTHFLALAWLVRLAVPADAPFLKWRVFLPMRRCGEQSLLIFCLGTFLALSGQVIVSHFEESLLSQVLVSVGGILIMCAAAWFKGGGPSGAGSSGAGRAAPAEAIP
jgi:hypothetical protein